MYTPKELMEYAAKKNLKAIAVTDHDTVSGLEESAHWAAYYGLEFIPGVEVEIDFKGFELHIIGYYIDYSNKFLLDFLKDLRTKRDERNMKVIGILKSDGIDTTLADMQKKSGHEIISRIHFARLLVDKGYYDSISEAIKNYLANGKKGYVKRALRSGEETFDVIRRAGGIPVLAHPIQYKIDSLRQEHMIKELKSAGLMGIEAIYPTNSPEDTERYIRLAKKYSLIISGGSDFHGEIKPGLDLGNGYGDLWVDYSVLEGLKRAASK